MSHSTSFTGARPTVHLEFLNAVETEMTMSAFNQQPGTFKALISAMTVRYRKPLFLYQVESLNPLISFYSHLRNTEY